MANLLKPLKTALSGGLLLGLILGSGMASSSPSQDNPVLKTTTGKASTGEPNTATTPQTTPTQGDNPAKAK
ncbi:MAG: hypothetical protein EB012_01710, partial [Gammaproteobacteria bacterium]|nr:hypothetical protein [Gammaproteobacteria bacterium]